MPKQILFVFLIVLAMAACGQDVDCPDTGLDIQLPPDNMLRDEGNLRIHRLAVWEDDSHQFEINSSSEGTHDFCVTLDDPTIFVVTRVYGQLLTADHHLKYSMELDLVPDLVGVYCSLLRVDGRDWNDREVAIFRAWVIVDPRDEDDYGYYNFRETEFIVEVP